MLFSIKVRRHEHRAFSALFGLNPSREWNKVAKLMEIPMKDEVDESMSRIYKADKTNDPKNLNRRGQQNLYLLLKMQENSKAIWRFHKGMLKRANSCMCEPEPIGIYHPLQRQTTQDDIVFFYKAHILAGQVCPDPDRYQDFAWLTKGEISKWTNGTIG